MSKDIEIARLLNVSVDTDTGRVFLEMEVTDPTWRQRILREWQDVDVKLVIEEKESIEDHLTKEAAVAYDEYAEISEETFAAVKEQINKWRPK